MQPTKPNDNAQETNTSYTAQIDQRRAEQAAAEAAAKSGKGGQSR